MEPELETAIEEMFATLRANRKRNPAQFTKAEILQELEHPAGSVKTFRERFGLSAVNFGVWNNILEKQLDETYAGDRRMTSIATGGINRKAA